MLSIRALSADDALNVVDDVLDMMQPLQARVHEAAIGFTLDVEHSVRYFARQLAEGVPGKLFVGAFEGEQLVGLVHYSLEASPFFVGPFALETFFIAKPGTPARTVLTLGRKSLEFVEGLWGHRISAVLSGNTLGVHKMEVVYKRIGYVQRGQSLIKTIGGQHVESSRRQDSEPIH